MSISSELDRMVRERAGDRCEYCRMHQSIQGATFHIEHVTPTSLGGASSEDNLALACPSCNLHKSNRTESVDLKTLSVVKLFHPREQNWADHFGWDSQQIVGKTPTGRATIDAFQLNHSRKIQIRRAEELLGLFPP